MDEDLKQWLKSYLMDILCGMIFWGIVFGIAYLIISNHLKAYCRWRDALQAPPAHQSSRPLRSQGHRSR